ncbi:hypothetical protein Tco_1209198 [Tanacetum coccineum]
MRTRSQSRRRRQQQTLPVVENFDLEDPIVEQNVVPMADNRTMAQMLQAPIEGYEDAIVVPPINANNFELKQPLINLVQSNKFTGRQDPHNHLRFFNKVTSTFRHPEVPNTSVKLLLFPFSLDGEARVRQTSVEPPNLEKPNNNQELFNPPIVTMADNRTMAQLLEAPTEGYEDAIVVPEITANNFEIKHGLLNLVQNKQFFGHDKEDPHAHIRYFNKITSTMKFPNVPRDARIMGFHNVHQLDTFYNSLNSNDQDSLNSATVVTFWKKCLDNAINQREQVQISSITSKAIVPNNTIANPKGDVKAITTRSGVSYNGPQISSPPKEKENEPEVTKDTVQPSTENIQPPVVRTDDQIGEPVEVTVYLEELLSVINSDPNLPPSPVCEINVPEKVKSSCEDPPDLELKDLPSHLEYAFLEGDDKLPIIIAKNLKDED